MDSIQNDCHTGDELDDVNQVDKFVEPFEFVIGSQKCRLSFNERPSPAELAFLEKQRTGKSSRNGVEYTENFQEYLQKINTPSTGWNLSNELFYDCFDNMHQMDTFCNEFPDQQTMEGKLTPRHFRHFVNSWRERKLLSLKVPEDTVNILFPRFISRFGELERRALHKKEAADELARLSYQAQLEEIKQKYDEEIALYVMFTPLMKLSERFSKQELDVRERYLRLYSETNGASSFDEWAELKWQSEKYDIFREMFISKLGEEFLPQFIASRFFKMQKGQ